MPTPPATTTDTASLGDYALIVSSACLIYLTALHYPEIKRKESIMLYFTSDHHFGHANIIRYCNRPFGDVEEMNRGLVDNWNETVAPSDEVWVLGDVAMGQREETLKLVRGLHGRKLLLPGNHDNCWHGHKGGERHLALYHECGFEHIFGGDTTLELAGEEVLVSHFPYRNDGPKDESFAKFRPADRGGWLLHGHVHDSWRQWNRMINTSVEAWDYRPVSAETIEGLIRAGETEEVVGAGASLASRCPASGLADSGWVESWLGV